MELKINNESFIIGRLDAQAQFHVWRRVMPIVLEFGASAKEAFGTMDAAPLPADPSPEAAQAMMAKLEDKAASVMMGANAAAIRVLSGMSDEDCDYVLGTCLNVVQKASGAGFAKVVTLDKRLPHGFQMMFQELDGQAMFQLVAAVIRENLGNFFNAPSPLA